MERSILAAFRASFVCFLSRFFTSEIGGSITRLTNAFSKKFENHCHALALYFFYYNFCRVHKTLGATPAMAAGVTDRIMKMEDAVSLIDAANRLPPVRGRLQEADTR